MVREIGNGTVDRQGLAGGCEDRQGDVGQDQGEHEDWLAFRGGSG